MIPLPRRALAEAIGTFFLCFTGVCAICINAREHGGSGLLGVAVAHGLALGIAISALGKVSGGHFNPAVSAAIMATRQMPPLAGLVYIVSQLIGATLAGFIARAAFSAEVFHLAGGGVPVPAADVSFGLAILLEAITTFFLVIAVFGTAVDIKAPQVGGFGIGLTVTFDILAIGPLTGASMNPARTFGPAVAANIWTGHAIYWIGPIVGGVVAGLIYAGFFMTPVPPLKPAGSGIERD
jgi:MIP family channel proteins